MESHELRRLIQRWAFVVMAMVAIGAGAAYAVARHTVPVYRAVGRLMVGSAITPPVSPVGAANSDLVGSTDEVAPTPFAGLSVSVDSAMVATVAALVAQPTLVAQAIGELHLSAQSSTLSEEVQSAPELGTALVDVAVNDPSPSRAAAIVNQLMDDLVTQLSPGAQHQSTASLQAEISATERKVRTTEVARAAALRGRQDVSGLDQTLAQANDNLTQLYTTLGTLQASQSSGAPGPVRLASAATPPATPASPRVSLDASLGAFAGLLIGSALCVVLGYFDQRLRTEADVRRMLNLPTLVSIPVFDATRLEEAVLAGEAYRRLRANLLFNTSGKTIRSLVVTSARAGEGKTRTAANVAAVIAASGQRVLLIDADLRQPTQHDLFGIAPGYGIADHLEEESNLGEPAVPGRISARGRVTRRSGKAISKSLSCERATTCANLSLMSSGVIPPNPAELLGSQRMSSMIHELEGDHDLVVMDTSAVGVVADALGLVGEVSATILVVEAGRTDAQEAQRAVDALRGVDARVVGVVLNKCPLPRSVWRRARSSGVVSRLTPTGGVGATGDEPAAATGFPLAQVSGGEPTRRGLPVARQHNSRQRASVSVSESTANDSLSP